MSNIAFVTQKKDQRRFHHSRDWGFEVHDGAGMSLLEIASERAGGRP